MADFTGTLGTRFVTLFLGLGTGIMTARMLGPEHRGIFALIALFPASVVALSKLGQGQATIYFIRREREEAGRVISNVLAVALGTSTLLVFLVLGCQEILLATVLNGTPAWALAIILPLIPLLLMESYLYAVLQATDRFRVFNTRLVAEAVLTLLAMALVLVILKLGLVGALGVVIVVRVVMGVWVILSVHKVTPIRLRFDPGLFRRMIRYGLKSHVQIIASHFHFKADVYMVAAFLDPAQVAFYSIAARLAEHLLYLPQSLGLALFPQLAGSDDERGFAMTARACRQTLVVIGLAALALGWTGRWLIPLWYGSDYARAAEPLPFVCGGIVMMAMYVLLSRSFTSRDRQFVNIVAAYTALAGNIVLNLILIPLEGIAGAAKATAVSYTAAACILLGFFVRESGLSLRDVLVLKRSDVLMWKRMALDLLPDRLTNAAPRSGGQA